MEMDNLALEDYCIFWKTHLRAMRQYGRHEGATDFATLLAVLAQIHPLSPAGLQHFAFHFTHGRRQTATLNPGLYMGFELPTDEALALDQKALLVTHVRTKISRRSPSGAKTGPCSSRRWPQAIVIRGERDGSPLCVLSTQGDGDSENYGL